MCTVEYNSVHVYSGVHLCTDIMKREGPLEGPGVDEHADPHLPLLLPPEGRGAENLVHYPAPGETGAECDEYLFFDRIRIPNIIRFSDTPNTEYRILFGIEKI